MKPRSARAKGTKLERDTMLALNAAGAKARKQPGSGIYADFKHDVFAVVPLVGDVLIECKSHKSPLATIRKWIGTANLLIHKANYEEPLVTMTMRHYLEMVARLSQAAGDLNEAPR